MERQRENMYLWGQKGQDSVGTCTRDKRELSSKPKPAITFVLDGAVTTGFGLWHRLVSIASRLESQKFAGACARKNDHPRHSNERFLHFDSLTEYQRSLLLHCPAVYHLNSMSCSVYC
jgi:hypothetical protein